MPPVPVGLALQVLILQRRAALTEEQRGDPLYAAESPYWPELFAGKRQEAIARYDGPSPPLDKKNNKARHTWWRGLTVDIVLQNFRAERDLRTLPPPSATLVFGRWRMVLTADGDGDITEADIGQIQILGLELVTTAILCNPRRIM